MTYITSLPPATAGAISGFSFISTMTLMALCLYQYISTGSISLCRKNILLFACNVVLLSYVTAAIEKDHVYMEIPIPFGLLIIIASAMMIYSAINVRRQFIENRNTPSPASIKQTLDNLDSGICFADSTGRIILINHTMSKLMAFITRNTPQTLYDINEILESLVHDDNSLYHFSNGEVWRFRNVLINDEDFKKTAVSKHSDITDRLTELSHKKFTQLTAHNVTELYNVNAALRQSSEALQRTNEKTTLMLNRLADRIREQETLNLKIQVHNDIGTSLISISEILEESSVPAFNNTDVLTDETIDKTSNLQNNINLQIKHLQNAVSYFTTTHNSHSVTLDELINEADNMNIALTLTGDRIDDDRIWTVTALALRECMTNTVKHAGGTALYADVTLTEGCYTITISNDGVPPTEDIREGGGLGSLRNRVTSIGGSMNIKLEPTFTLRLILPIHPVIQITESVNQD